MSAKPKRATALARRGTRATPKRAAAAKAAARAKTSARAKAAPATKRAAKHAHLPVLTPRAVAALFLERQWLDRPRARRLGAANLQAFVERTCGLQIDSVNVIDRAHHLTLWSRFGAFDRQKLERLVYRRRVLFEYLSHVACFVATSDLPIWRGLMVPLPERWAKKYGDPMTTMPVAEVEAAIAEAGVMGNADFERTDGERAGGWWTWKPAQHALDYLWKAGRIAVHSRVHFQKRYALMDRVLPHAKDVAPLAREQVFRTRVVRSLQALGAATRDDLASYWTWPRLTGPDLSATLNALVADGTVREWRVEGSPLLWYALAADDAALARAARARRPSRGTTLLCPFDSFLWHRERVHRLWGYFYRIEIYVPGHQRTHGYYTLPLMHEGHLIGRVDLKNHRETRVLEAKHVHFEPWFAAGERPPGVAWGTLDRDEAFAGLADALHSLAGFLGAERVTLGRVTPGSMKPALARRLGAGR